MGSLERRLERLEGRIEPPEDEGAEIRRALMIATLDEIGRLKGARANSHYRGGTPPTPIQPTDPAGERLGYPYTTGQMNDLAIELVWKREGLPEDLMEDWKYSYKELAQRAGCDLEKVEAYGPPEPTPPYRQRLRYGA